MEPTATNANGDKIVYRGGQWVPMDSAPAPQTSAPQFPGVVQGRPKPPEQPKPVDPREVFTDTRDTVSDLRKEFRGLPTFENYDVALQTFNSSLSTADNAQGDQSLITSYAKMLDPTSAVREGEFDTTANTQRWLDKVRADLKKQFGFEGGGMLSPEGREFVRNEMWNLVNKRFRPAYERDRTDYTSLADRYQYDPIAVVGSDPLASYSGAFDEYLNPKTEATDQTSASGADEEGLQGGVSYEGETEEQRSARILAEADRMQAEQSFGAVGGTIDDAATLGKQGISLGLSDEAAGLGGALSGIFNGQGIVGGYTQARDQERARIDIARENLGGVGTALEVAGGGAGILARPGQVMAAGRSVAASGQPISRPAVQNALARRAGADGAKIGAVGGFGYGEGLEGSAINAAGGAALGGALGYGGQRLGNALANRATPRRDASDLARAGQAEGVTVNRAMADPNLENTFSGAEASTAGPRINKAMNEIEGQVSGRVEALGRGARAEQPDVRGGTVQDTVTDYLGTTKERAGRLFEQVSVPPETRVQLGSTRQALAEITEGMKSNPELSQIWVSHPRLRRTLDALTPEDIATPASKEVKKLSFDLESAEDALVRLNRSEEGGSPEAEALRSTIADIKQRLQRADRQSQRAPMGGEVSWKDMKRLRTIVGEITGQPGLSADGAQTKAMRKFYAAISSDMESTATAMGPVAQKQWQRASDAWAKRENFVDNIASKLVGDPNNPRSTRQAANTVDAWVKGDFSRFQKLWGSFSKNERDMIRASVADELGRNAKGEFTPAHFLNATSGKTRAASDRALRLMFGEDGVRSIQNLRTLSTELNRLNAKRNSSNTGRVNTYRDWLANALLGGGGVGAGVGFISGSGATGAAAAIGTAAAVGGANSVRNTLTANMLLNPKISKWLAQAPRTQSPKAIDAHFNRLGQIAKAEPALAGEIELLRKGILGAANDNAPATLAAENQNAEEVR